MTKALAFLAIALLLAAGIATPASAAGSPGFASTHSIGSAARTTSPPYSSGQATRPARR
jgi:hypothetical protein